MDYVMYIRRSQDRDDKQVLSIEAQRRELLKLAKEEGLKVISVFEESQSAYRTGRPKFEKMLKLFEQGKAQGLLVWHLTRIARNSSDGGKVIYMMDEKKLKEIKTINKTYYDDPNDKFFLQIEFGVAKKSSDDTSQLVKRDIKTKLNKGEYPGIAPIGYINLDSQGRIAGKAYSPEKQKYFMELAKKRPLKRIEIDPVDGPIIRELFQWMAIGQHSVAEIRKRGNNMGLRGKARGKELAVATVFLILSNPFYYGTMRYNGELHPGNYEPLITKQIFTKVQTIMKNHSRPRTKAKDRMFRGVMVCGECGCAITMDYQKGHTYYRCTKKKGDCSQKYLRAEIVEPKLREAVIQATVPGDFIEWARNELRNGFEKETKDIELIRKELQAKLNNINAEISGLVKLKISPFNADGSMLTDEDFKTQKLELSDNKNSIESRINALSEHEMDFIGKCEKFFDFSAELDKKFSEGNFETKRYILHLIGSKIILKDGNILVQFEKPYDSIVRMKQAKNARLEPQKTPVPQGEAGVFVDDSSIWRAFVYEVTISRTHRVENRL